MGTWALLAVSAVLQVSGCAEESDDAPPSVADANAVVHSIDARSIEQSLAAAQEYMQSNDFPKATAILVTLIQKAPREVRGRELYGQVLGMQAQEAARQGEEERARELWERAWDQYAQAVSLDDRSAGLRHSAGSIALMAGKLEAALLQFQAAATIDPLQPQHPLFAAQVLMQLNRIDEARLTARRALELDRDEPVAYATLAMIEVERGEFEEALVLIGEARRISPDDLGIRAQHAKVLRRSGNHQAALELLIGLTPAQRATEPVAAELAALHLARNEPRQAAAAWEELFAVNPSGEGAFRAALQAAECFAKAGDVDAALHWLQEARARRPQSPRIAEVDRILETAVPSR